MNVQEQFLHCEWNELKDRIRDQWDSLTEKELDRVEGNFGKLTDLIQRKSGESRKAVEKQLEKLTSDSMTALAHAGEAIRNAATQASETISHASTRGAEAVHDVADEAVKQVQAGYIQAKRLVNQRPVESMAVVFGLGIVTGLVSLWMFRSR